MSNSKYSIDQLISAKSIAARVETLAKDITNHFINTEKLIVVGLLRGSFVFIADLAREIDLPIEIDFLEASSYGNSTESSREVKILKDFPSHPVLFCLKNIGKPYSKKISIEKIIIIGKETKMKITDRSLSISVLNKKLVP